MKEYEKASSLLLKTLTKNEIKSIRKYSLVDYKKINRFLLGEPKQNTKLEEKIKNIDSAIAKYNLEDDIIVYRGTERKYYEDLNEDDIIQEKVYYSTSLSKEVAEQFVIDRKNPSDGILVEIRAPKGSNVLYIGNNGSFEFEQEMLIGRNTKYKVLEIGRNKIILEIIN
ncbi:ADP-ribosyltransferase [Candidatus Arthromitus sp. SFB-mouse]|uniref:ADP-ribosyltransferase n=1 Tax=Candidatus Arthromitus sp. SFB-mouse TaxID=49118 RepID=UPI0009DAE783